MEKFSNRVSENLIRTRGNKYKLLQHHCHYDLRKFNFINRVIPVWTSLSTYVVSADTVNTFKHCLDKFWSNQEVLYNYRYQSWPPELDQPGISAEAVQFC